MADLNTLFSTLGKIAADGESYAPATGDNYVNEFIAGYEAEKAKLNGGKANPQEFILDAFDAADVIAALVGNPQIVALISDLQTAESDAARGAILVALADLLKVYKDIKALRIHKAAV